MIRMLVGIASLALAGAAIAQASYTVEEVAQVKDNETSRLVTSSVREAGGERLFEVVVKYTDPADAPAGGVASRSIIYRARCDNKELSISVINLRDARGRTAKTIMVPPGAEEYFKPAAGSREDDWLYRVCG